MSCELNFPDIPSARQLLQFKNHPLTRVCPKPNVHIVFAISVELNTIDVASTQQSSACNVEDWYRCIAMIMLEISSYMTHGSIKTTPASQPSGRTRSRVKCWSFARVTQLCLIATLNQSIIWTRNVFVVPPGYREVISLHFQQNA
jgi:hypothetical protein